MGKQQGERMKKPVDKAHEVHEILVEAMRFLNLKGLNRMEQWEDVAQRGDYKGLYAQILYAWRRSIRDMEWEVEK